MDWTRKVNPVAPNGDRRPLTSALLISTYNRPDALNRCLESILVQTIMPDRIIIADDGSGDDTRSLIDNFKTQFAGNRCIHVWQPDRGFRVARIRNKALYQAEDLDYIIQIDGDMVMHRFFIADHLYLAEQGYYVRGNKYLLNQQETQEVLNVGLSALRSFSFPLSRIAKARRIVPLRNLFNALRPDIKGVFGSNMAYWRSDAVEINGYCNVFSGWGSEDDDFADRLRLRGTRCKSIKFGAIAFHLHHPLADMSFVKKNQLLRTTNTSQQMPRAEDGLLEARSNPD